MDYQYEHELTFLKAENDELKGKLKKAGIPGDEWVAIHNQIKENTAQMNVHYKKLHVSSNRGPYSIIESISTYILLRVSFL